MGCTELKWTAFELLLDALSAVIVLDLVLVVVQYEAVLPQDANGSDSPLELNTGYLPGFVESRVRMGAPLIFENDQYKMVPFLKT